MKKATVIIIACVTAASATAQNTSFSDSYAGVIKQSADTTACVDTTAPIYVVDSLYLGKNIFDVLPSGADGKSGKVTVTQGDSTRFALESHIISNYSRTIPGYRIRIFFSNNQRARDESADAATKFHGLYPGYGVYRIYVSPNFKVTVGDFRNKSDALRLLDAVRQDFPYAFIVRENIRLF